MMALHPKLIDLTLDRMWRLLDALGHPQRALPPVIHIAGTNGKGSTLGDDPRRARGAGLRVHAYTSPASRAVPRTHPACGRSDRRRSPVRHARPLLCRQRPRSDHLFRDHHRRRASWPSPRLRPT
jgi:hypothetical protein